MLSDYQAAGREQQARNREQLRQQLGDEAFDAIPDREGWCSLKPAPRPRVVRRRKRNDPWIDLITSGRLVPRNCPGFTPAQLGVLAIYFAVVRQDGYCRLTAQEIAARVPCCVRVVRSATKEAERRFLIKVERKKVSRYRHAPNTVTINEPRWAAWVKLSPGGPRLWGGGRLELEAEAEAIRVPAAKVEAAPVAQELPAPPPPQQEPQPPAPRPTMDDLRARYGSGWGLSGGRAEADAKQRHREAIRKGNERAREQMDDMPSGGWLPPPQAGQCCTVVQTSESLVPIAILSTTANPMPSTNRASGSALARLKASAAIPEEAWRRPSGDDPGQFRPNRSRH